MRSLSWCLLLTAFIMGFVGSAAADEGKDVVYSYYAYPPFVIEGNQGLTHDFLELMNQSAWGKYDFHVHTLPRKRIDMYLEENEPSIVLFVNPAWIAPPTSSDATWTAPIFADRNGIISNKSKKVEFDGVESVHDLTMGGVFGRKYKGLDSAVGQGLIKREDTADEELNVLKLAERRIDFMTAPESVLRYLVNRLEVEDRIYFSTKPLFEYTRHILLSNVDHDLREFILQFVRDLPNNPGWHALKKKYHLQ